MSESSSGDSSSDDNGERVKNIRSKLVKIEENQRELDENYAYKRKLGDLIFDANFEAGNLGFVEQIDRHHYDLMIRPDVSNPRHRVWFNFIVSNQHPNQLVVFTIVNLSEQLALFHEGLTPVARSRLHPNWCRLRRDQVFYYKSRSHSNRPVLSIAFRFIDRDNEHQFALFYPYSYSQLESFINRWQIELKRRRRRQVEELQVEVLSKSVLLKSLYMLKLTSGDGASADKPTVILIRQTSGNFDGCSSLVCQGFVDQLLSDCLMGRSARQQFEVVVFPMIDPDANCSGNSRTDLFGQTKVSTKLIQTNRNLYENFHRVREQLEKIWGGPESRRPIVILDLLVNPNLIGARLIGTKWTDQLRMEQHQHLARLMSQFSEGFYLENCLFESAPPLHERSVFDFHNHANVQQYRLEVSPFAYYRRSLIKRVYKEYSRERYLKLGKSLVFSLLKMFSSWSAEAELHPKVHLMLESFYHNAADIDDLMLKR